jgi:hypothetical protein
MAARSRRGRRSSGGHTLQIVEHKWLRRLSKTD